MSDPGHRGGSKAKAGSWQTLTPDAAWASVQHQVRMDLQQSGTRIFECLRNLGCLAHWWPGATAVRPLPPGLFGVGDSGLLELKRGTAWFQVEAYQAGQHIALLLTQEDSVLRIELQVDASPVQTCVLLRLSQPSHGTSPIAAWWRSWRLRVLCRRAAVRLRQHLRESPTVNSACLR